MLSHANLLFSAKTLTRLLNIQDSDSMISFLPPHHITEQVLSVHVPVVSRCRIYFAEGIAKLSRNMREIQPTLVFAPPELWRKIYLALQVCCLAPFTTVASVDGRSHARPRHRSRRSAHSALLPYLLYGQTLASHAHDFLPAPTDTCLRFSTEALDNGNRLSSHFGPLRTLLSS